MTRRMIGLILMLALGVYVAPLAADTPSLAKITRIGVLLFSRPDAPQTQSGAEAFRQGLQAHGWVEGQNLAIEWGSADGRAERLPALAADLIQLPVQVLVTHGPTIRPAQQATHTLPMVMAVVTDPVGSGLVASLARPGGHLTGGEYRRRGAGRQAPGTAHPSRASRVAGGHPVECGLGRQGPGVAEDADRSPGLGG